MFIEDHRPLAVDVPRRWRLAILPPAIVTLALAAALREAPQAVAADEQSARDKSKAEARLKYHDDSAEGKKSIAGSGEMIEFERPGDEGKLTSIRIHGSRYGLPQPPKEDFTISVLNEDRSEVLATKLAPYSLFKRGPETWVSVKFPKPVDVPKKFWIVLEFHAERTKGVYVSYDKSTGGSHSRIGLPGMESRETDFGGDWMIEGVLAP